MKANHIGQLLRWVLRIDRSLTVSRFFEKAYEYHHGQTNGDIVRRDLALFSRYHHVPYYVSHFAIKELYPRLIHKGGIENPKEGPKVLYLGRKK